MLTVKNLNVIYNHDVKAIKDVNLNLEEGKVYGILGPSGAGKSSFIKGLLNLVPCKGEVKFRGKPIKEFAKETAYVEQKENLDRHFPITAFQCALLGTYPKLGFFKRPGETERQLAQAALEQVEMGDFANRQIGELSGGQFQRVLIARALTQNAELLFLDEPFVGIDVNNEAIVIKLLKKMAADGKTIFIVHHNLDKVKNYFENVILINKKVIAYGDTSEVYTKKNIGKTFKIFAQQMNSNL